METRRLYNEYGAAVGPAADRIHEIMAQAVQKIWQELVVVGGFCPRDTMAVCQANLDVDFCQRIIGRAIHIRKARGNYTKPVNPQGEAS